MKKILFSFGVIVLFSLLTGTARADTTKNILIVLDASGSMNDAFGSVSRISAAKSTISDLMASIDPSILVGFRPFAHIKKTVQADACKVTEFLQPFTTDHTLITNDVNQIQAVGQYTDTAYALLQAKNDFTVGNDNALILLTDGKETCGGDTAAAAKALLDAGIKVKTYVIGLGLDAASRTELSGVATAGGGQYFDANDTTSLANSLKAIQAKEKPIDKTNTDAVLGTAIRGGNGYDTAVDILPGKYHLDHDQKSGEFDYFKITTIPSVLPITFKIQTGDTGVKYDSKTNTFLTTHETSGAYNVYAGFKLMDPDRAELNDRVSVEGANQKNTINYGNRTAEENLPFVYLLVGTTIGDMAKNAIFTIEATAPVNPTPVTPPPTTPPDTTNNGGNTPNNNNTPVTPPVVPIEGTAPSGGNMMPLIIGGGVLLAVLFTVIIVMILKKKPKPIMQTPMYNNMYNPSVRPTMPPQMPISQMPPTTPPVMPPVPPIPPTPASSTTPPTNQVHY